MTNDIVYMCQVLRCPLYEKVIILMAGHIFIEYIVYNFYSWIERLKMSNPADSFKNELSTR